MYLSKDRLDLLHQEVQIDFSKANQIILGVFVIKNQQMYNHKHMGSQLAEIGKTSGGVGYRIFNIDNVYTVYLQIGTQLNPDNSSAKETVYSAVKSFPTLKEAQDYVKQLK